ncbi:putative motility protein [Bordetella genomosp. 11]|uniref:Motility protein n=1 Tax=Bordetella genomosp. 11 TaxID=1416808 RepID=A0A261UYY6_9BORD|nr:putative motility protein [Bordetella genomosp. 11]OZI66885.1 hypothetical protein CAL28_03970 [Bordetella genomosp. 11]
MDSSSIEATVGAAVGLQQANAMQEAQNVLLRKTLDSQSQTILSLIGSVAPQLSSYGMVGTQLHVTA